MHNSKGRGKTKIYFYTKEDDVTLVVKIAILWGLNSVLKELNNLGP